ncbi:hypothetical protein LINPERHAP1_LOCUS21550 [Linum perenne]
MGIFFNTNMTRKKKTNCASAHDEGSCSHNMQKLPWSRRAIITTQPFEHWKKPTDAVIRGFQRTLYSTSNQLATLRQRK